MLYTSFSPIQPVTTTSLLSPQLGTVQFPSLMSQHQISQGYHPSPGSIFHRPSPFLSTPRGSDSVPHNLKTVSFPRDCMDWFTSIASINTAKNRETCGLLLGKDKGGRYVVTTLLIPKQHSTSDTCTMDEEGLVMRFTEVRSLITLGWVRRHLCWWI
jgi:STAM-binding protein